jgi:phosphate transport system protein
MPRNTFDQEMQEIRDEILLLSSMVEQSIMYSVEALKDNDLRRSRQILSYDSRINQKRFEIETTIMVLIATQQPIAHDLRLLVASLDICTELERMGDYAKGIAHINLRSGGLGLPHIVGEIFTMAEKAVAMLHRAMTTFADENQEIARAIIREDDEIDKWYLKLYNDAIDSVVGDPRHMERAHYVIWAAHNLERLGDRVTNVCERVVYIVTGERPILDPILRKTKLSLGEL